MRVLLINPPPHQRVDEYDTPNFTRLGLVSLAGQLRADGVTDTALVDAKFERLDYGEVVDRVRRFAPDLVGLTAFTNEIEPAARVARLVKKLSPSIATVIGGVHATALPEQTLLEFPAFDLLVSGEGEATFSELVRALARGARPDGVAGVWSRDGGAVTGGGERPRIADQDTIPIPAWDLVPRSPRYLFMTQRGCSYACTFCMNPNGRTVRRRSVEHVMAELELLTDRYRAEELYMCDEIFTADRERAHRLLDAMIAAGVGRKLRWSAQTHVNLVDRELFAKMKAAGCYICGLGIETGDEDRMRAMKKGSTRSRVVEAREAARQAGLPIEGLFIIGHPHETWSSAMRTIDFAVELNPERPIVGVMVPYPGTQVAELARRGEGGYRLLSSDWNDYNKQIGHALAFEHLSRRDLEILQMLAYVKVFVGNRRFSDLAAFVWKYRSEGIAVMRKILLGRMPRREPLADADRGAAQNPTIGERARGLGRSLPIAP